MGAWWVRGYERYDVEITRRSKYVEHFSIDSAMTNEIHWLCYMYVVGLTIDTFPQAQILRHCRGAEMIVIAKAGAIDVNRSLCVLS